VAVFVSTLQGLANITSLDLRGSVGVDWSKTYITLHACGLEQGQWSAGISKLAVVSPPSYCLFVNVTKSMIDTVVLTHH
jgi:hypothetical protein